MHILIEPIKDRRNNPVELLRQIISKRQDAVITTVFSIADRKQEQGGTYALLTERNGETKKTPALLLADMQSALADKSSNIAEYESFSALIDFLSPAISLLVFGAGNDVIPLTQMASVLGWQIAVIDGRPNYATAARFPKASNVLIAKPEEAMQQIIFDENTVAVLITHNYNYDIAMLAHLLPLQLPYVGLLGPKTKLQRMIQELQEKGIHFTEEQLTSLYGPTGLDIGSETAEEIALSVLSEIKMVITNRNGSSLRKKLTPIHAGS